MSNTKVALVTGSSSGIGEATVKLLAKEGYKVAVTGSQKDKVDRVVEECAKLSPHKFQPLGLVYDFYQPDSGEQVVKKTVEHFGRLDLLVNNTGLFLATDPSDSSSYDNYKKTMTINLDTTVRATLAAVEHLKQSKGCIIFVSSGASVRAAEKGYAYCMSKTAMVMFAKCLAVDLAARVRVNVVGPGPVQTPFFQRLGMSPDEMEDAFCKTTLEGRVGTPEEIANAIHFLASDKATFIQGQELFVDGGFTIRPANFSGPN